MTAAPVLFDCPQGRFQLKRYPRRPREPLQAWSSADRLLLEEASTRRIAPETTLVVNDEQGALCVALSPHALWTDSWLAAEAARRNQGDNGLGSIAVHWSMEPPPKADTVILRLPKSQPYLEYQLATLAGTLEDGALVLAAGMDKHLSPRTASTLEDFIGPTERFPGRHKARLFAANCRADRAATPAGAAAYSVPTLPFPLSAHSNVFSPDRPDPGTQLLLSVLEDQAPASLAVDLACGNGIVGLHLLHWNLADSVLFCDESAMAIASARENLPPRWQQRADFRHGDGLQGVEAGADLVVLNPPFHLGHVVDEYAGRRLIQQAHDALTPGGLLILVFNNHLRYRSLLRRLFHETKELARDRKFSVVMATRA